MSSDNGQIIQRSYLRSDLSVVCDESNAHKAITSLATIFVLIWPVGSLAVYAAALLSCRNAINQRAYTPLVNASKFLTRDYKPEYSSWDRTRGLCLQLLTLARR